MDVRMSARRRTRSAMASPREQRGSSNRVPLEAPVVALGLLQHLPESALPLAGFFILLLDPRLHRFVVIARPRGLVEQWSPSILVFTNQLDLLEGILRFPLLHLLPDLADGGLCCDWNGKHAQGREDLHFRHVVLVALGNFG